MYPQPAGLEDLFDRYVEFLIDKGTDPRIGLRLSHLLKAAGLLVEDFRGLVPIVELPLRGPRGPAWAARDAMLAAGAIGQDDIDRWEKAFRALDSAAERPLLFLSPFVAVGRRRVDQS